MGRYYSPSGNCEIWDEPPAGYQTEADWLKAHPAPAPKAPTEAEKAEAAREERAARRAQIDAESIPLLREGLLNADPVALSDLIALHKEYAALVAADQAAEK